MSMYLFKDIPSYNLSNFVPVRDSYDNLLNILTFIDIVYNNPHCRTNIEDDAQLAIFSGSSTRLLVKKDLGFYTMCLPFQIIDHGEYLLFNFDLYGIAITSKFISIMRSCIESCRNYGYSHEDILENIIVNYSVDYRDAVNFCDVFTILVTDDHGYFRFDDDEPNERGRVHPRYHFDFYYKNSSAIKIGSDKNINFNFFKKLFDRESERPYLQSVF